MAKRPSEAAFGKALREIDASVPIYVFHPADPKMGGGVSNWKPCDFMAWSTTEVNVPTDESGVPLKLVDVAWFECKDIPAIGKVKLSGLLEKSQLQGIREARRIGIPYWLAIFWRTHKWWSISDAVRLDAAGMLTTTAPSISRDLLTTRFGIDAAPANLTSTLKSILAGEV